MTGVLVDSSVWIAFFKGTAESRLLFPLLDSNQLCINDLILAELIPYLNHKKGLALVSLLGSVGKLDMDIDWNGITRIQTSNLKHGINRAGIPDLIIAQNAVQNRVTLLSFDGHFELMNRHMGLKTFERP
jgi:predicted nucleic acid-binding protein